MSSNHYLGKRISYKNFNRIPEGRQITNITNAANATFRNTSRDYVFTELWRKVAKKYGLSDLPELTRIASIANDLGGEQPGLTPEDFLKELDSRI